MNNPHINHANLDPDNVHLKHLEESLISIIKSSEQSLQHAKNEELRHLSIHLRTNINDLPDQFIADEIHYLSQLTANFQANTENLNAFNKNLPKALPNHLQTLVNQYLFIINETNKSILSLQNKITQLISSRMADVKTKMNKGELSSDELNTYPKMIAHLNLVLAKMKTRTIEEWEIWNDFETRWTQYVNEEWDHVHNHLNDDELRDLKQIKTLLAEIRNKIGTKY